MGHVMVAMEISAKVLKDYIFVVSAITQFAKTVLKKKTKLQNLKKKTFSIK
jgi:hypothetical protein